MIAEQRLSELCSIRNKLERAMRYIQDSGYVDRWLIQGAVLDIEVSESTMYRARKKLHLLGAIHADGKFYGRYIPADEIASLFDELPRIVHFEQIANRMFSNTEFVYFALKRAEKEGLLKMVNGGTTLMYTRIEESAS